MLELKTTLEYAIEVGAEEAIKKYPEIKDTIDVIKSSTNYLILEELMNENFFSGDMKINKILEYDDDIRSMENAIEIFIQFFELINKLRNC